MGNALGIWRRPDKYTPGFTIVELLIVVVVIAILATVTVVSYNGVTTHARYSKIKTDIQQLVQASIIARDNSGKTLIQITNNNATPNACFSKATGTDLSTLPKTDACWTDYFHTLQAISDASGVNVMAMVDPWGWPYLIDENEGEGGTWNCTHDSIAVYARPLVNNGWQFDPATPPYNLPLSGVLACP